MHAGNNPILKMLRLMRLFRVARLFKKIRSLNRIMHSLVAALLPVCNSFVILVLVTGTVAASPFFFENTFSFFTHASMPAIEPASMLAQAHA